MELYRWKNYQQYRCRGCQTSISAGHHCI